MKSVFLTTFLLVLAGCSLKPDYKVAGAEWLEEDAGGGMYDVLAYPLTEDELLYFENSLEAVESVAATRRSVWEEIAVAEDPVWASGQRAFWKGTGLNGEDVIAVSLKLTFLWEFGSTDEPIEADIRESLQFLEARMQGNEANADRLEAADSMRAILVAIEAHKEAGAFAFYEENKGRIDAALDRFTSIGEQ